VASKPTARASRVFDTPSSSRFYRSQLVDDPEYREALRRRLIAGTAGGVEILMWHYAKGKPVDRIEAGAPGAFADVPTDELKARLRQALGKL